MAGIAKSIEQTSFSEPILTGKILQLRKLCEEHAHSEFTSPINDWQDFKFRLGQVERAYKCANFDENLNAAAGELYSYLRRLKEEKVEEPEYWHALALLNELNDIFHLSEELGASVLQVGKRVQYELHDLSDGWGTVWMSTWNSAD